MTALPAPSVALDDQLCFALYAASRAVTARYRPMLDEIGLTYPQYLVMMLLWESDHQTVGQLGSRLALDSGTLSPLLKRLTAAGLVTRHRRVEDERSVSIALTDKGRELHDRALGISEAMIGTIGFDTDEFDGLLLRLRLLTDRVNSGQALEERGEGAAVQREPRAELAHGLVVGLPEQHHDQILRIGQPDLLEHRPVAGRHGPGGGIQREAQLVVERHARCRQGGHGESLGPTTFRATPE